MRQDDRAEEPDRDREGEDEPYPDHIQIAEEVRVLRDPSRLCQADVDIDLDLPACIGTLDLDGYLGAVFECRPVDLAERCRGGRLGIERRIEPFERHPEVGLDDRTDSLEARRGSRPEACATREQVQAG